MIPKFRAWNKQYKEMREVVAIDFYHETYSWILDDYREMEQSWEDDNIEDVILMQYTGSNDKNGVEIYEGDVVNVTQYFGGHSFGQLPHVVKVSKYSNVLILYALSKQNYVEEYTLYFSEIKDYEVIGNIYENLEVMEVAE